MQDCGSLTEGRNHTEAELWLNNRVTQSFTQMGRERGETTSVEIKNNALEIDLLQEEATVVGKFPTQSRRLR